NSGSRGPRRSRFAERGVCVLDGPTRAALPSRSERPVRSMRRIPMDQMLNTRRWRAVNFWTATGQCVVGLGSGALAIRHRHNAGLGSWPIYLVLFLLAGEWGQLARLHRRLEIEVFRPGEPNGALLIRHELLMFSYALSVTILFAST